MVEIPSIRSKIEREIRSRWWRARAPHLVGRALATTAPGSLGGDEEVRRFIEQYIKAVPGILEDGLRAAERAGVKEELEPLIELAAGYWEWEDDLIPDRLGLLGLLDDAYLTLRLLERFAADRRDSTETSPWERRLAPFNRQMAVLLGDELAARLDQEVEAALRQSELQVAIVALGACQSGLENRELLASVSESGRELPNEEIVGRVVEAEKDRFDRRQTIFGNVSLLTLVLGVGVFTFWQLDFRYPSKSTVSIFGWDGLELAWLDRLRMFILGSLGVSALFEEGNLKTLIKYAFWPFRHLKAAELKRFLAAPGTMAFSLLSAVLFCWVAFSNVAVLLVPEPEGSDYMELVVDLFRPRGAFFFTRAEETGDVERRRARLVTGGAPIRLGLPGLDADAVLVVRDKYSLITVDAYSVSRTPLGIQIEPLMLAVPPPGGLDAVERKEYEAPEGLERRASFGGGGRWTVTLTGVRWNRGIYSRVRDENGTWWGTRQPDKRLSAKPADGRRCPAPSDLKPVHDFWSEMCLARRSVAGWTSLSNMEGPGFSSVFYSLPSFDLEIHFARGLLTGATGQSFRPLDTREAIRVVADHRASAR